MLHASLRLGFVLAALVASLPAAAESRFWTLNGVRFDDGAVATGYFRFDPATGTVADWNVRVSAGAGPFIAWTFVPGNSIATGPFAVYSYSPGVPGAECCWDRDLDITPIAALDGSSSSVAINVCHDCLPRPSFGRSRDTFTGYYSAGPSRKIIAGSFVLAPVEPPVTIVQVDEFYHRELRHYFITADAAEKQALDTGVHPGWERTGQSFKAYAPGSRPGGSISPVCRYSGIPERGQTSHFYSAYGWAVLECVDMVTKFRADWRLESDNVFQIHLPDTTTGACPGGTVPVYRLWNQRRDSNHRYTTSAAIRADMVATGHVAEGYGPQAVAMCAVQ